jgi:hypothetical protein
MQRQRYLNSALNLLEREYFILWISRYIHNLIRDGSRLQANQAGSFKEKKENKSNAAVNFTDREKASAQHFCEGRSAN